MKSKRDKLSPADKLADAARVALAGAETWAWLASAADVADEATRLLALEHAACRRIEALGLETLAAIVAAGEVTEINRRAAVRRAA